MLKLVNADDVGEPTRRRVGRRGLLDEVLAANLNLELSAKVASSHSKILRSDSPAVAQAVRELAGITV